MNKLSIVKILVLQAVVLTQFGCRTYEPTEVPVMDGMPKGPGLLTGEKGYYEVEFGR